MAAQSLTKQQKKMTMMGLFRKPMTDLQGRNANIDAIVIKKTEANANSPSKDERKLKQAINLLHFMDFSAYASLLQECSAEKAIAQGKAVHARIIYTGYQYQCRAVYVNNNLITMYAKCGALMDARRVFDEMSERNVISWTAVIAAYGRHGSADEALALFCQMQRSDIRSNQFTFASVLPACYDLVSLKELHQIVIASGFQYDVVVGNVLVTMYTKCGSIEDARQVFDRSPQRNVVSWNTMIAGYAQNGQIADAERLFEEMPERNVVSWNTLITGCAENGQIDEAWKLFQKIPEPNVVSWTAMISAYAKNGYVDNAFKLFQKMPERNMVSWNAMIAGYAQNGLIDEALELFHKMPGRNLVSWNAMIAGNAQHGNNESALNFFQQMQHIGVKPNSETFTSVLSACAGLTSLEQGKEVHGEIIRCGFQSDVFVGSALVNMYGKCGSIKNARRVFDKMNQRDVVSWTAMIEGYAMHGCGKEALMLFEEMKQSGTKPNDVTLLGVLSACCHSGLVNEGLQYFNYMSQYYHIEPGMEHYSCMVNLLGRAGQFDEAQNFINKMPIKPGVTVWGSLLGACRIHNNIKLGEQIAEHIFVLEPENCTPYMILSNMYAESGRWDDVEKLQRLMKDGKVKKKPGCSWIEVDEQVYAFVVEKMVTCTKTTN